MKSEKPTCITTVSCDIRDVADIYSWYASRGTSFSSFVDIFRKLLSDTATVLREKGEAPGHDYHSAYTSLELLLPKRTKESKALLSVLAESPPESDREKINKTVADVLEDL